MTSLDSKPELIQPPRGTHDILPEESPQWQYLENTARNIIQDAGYGEIRVPVFEHTELFKRGVGEDTDIVNKEMYTFTDRSGRSLTLRPEGTAGAVRAYLSGGLHRQSPPVKLWYTGPMMRYERPQAGRQRQFHQIGVEAFGSEGPLIDAEVIFLGTELLKKLELSGLELKLNSIGCPDCRPLYKAELLKVLSHRLKELCTDCQERFQSNPLRMLDCKNENCQAQYHDVPTSLDHLCKNCQQHWDELLQLVSKFGIKHTVDHRLVRGLDYYTRTVFEILTNDPRLKAQSTVLGGGRYDYLVETLGGPHTPAVGWALGMERLILLSKQSNPQIVFAFVVSPDPARALDLALTIRQAGISCDLDYPPEGNSARGLSRQLQQANKSGAGWAVIATDDEWSTGQVLLKNLKTSSQEKISSQDLVKFLTANFNQKIKTSCPG